MEKFGLLGTFSKLYMLTLNKTITLTDFHSNGPAHFTLRFFLFKINFIFYLIFSILVFNILILSYALIKGFKNPYLKSPEVLE